MSVLASKLKADLNYLSILDADRRDEIPATVKLLLGADRTIVVAADGDQGGDDLRKHLSRLAGSKRKTSLVFLDLGDIAKTDRSVAVEDLLPWPEWLTALQEYVFETLGSSHEIDRDRLQELAADQPLANAAAEYLKESGVLKRRSAMSKTSIAAAFLRQEPSIPSASSPIYALCSEVAKALHMTR